MKRTLGIAVSLSASAFLLATAVIPSPLSNKQPISAQGVINEGATIMDGITDNWCSADLPDDNLELFESLVLIGGWGERLDTAGNGKPSYTVFAPYDSVINGVLDTLGTTIGDLASNPAAVAAILADHIANGSFETEDLENPNLTRITMRSGYSATVSTSDVDPTDRDIYEDVYVAGQFISDGYLFENGSLYCINGFIDSFPTVPTDGINSPDTPTDGTPGGFALTWSSPSSPTSSRHLLFELEFSGVSGLSAPLTSVDFENLGTQQNCSMDPIPENGSLPSRKFFLVVTCNGTGTVHPQLKATSVNVPNGSGTTSISIANARTGAPIDIVNGLVLTIDKTGNGQGNVSSNISGVDCGPMCVGVFQSRTRITLTPQPEPGSIFTGWNGACSGMAPCQLTVNSSVTATANFELATKITAHGVGTGAGTVSSSPAGLNCSATSGSSCSGTIAPGTKVTLQARANRGSRFLGWMGACTGTSPCTFTTQGPGQIIHVFAIFEQT